MPIVTPPSPKPETVTLLISLPVKTAQMCNAQKGLSMGLLTLKYDVKGAQPLTRIPPYNSVNFTLPDPAGAKANPQAAFEAYTVARNLVAASASIYQASLAQHTAIPGVPCLHTIVVPLADDTFSKSPSAAQVAACPTAGETNCIILDYPLPATITADMGLNRAAAADYAITLSEQTYLH